MSAISVTLAGGDIACGGSRAVGALARRDAYRIGAHPVYPVMLPCFLVLSGAQATSDGLATWDAVYHVLLTVGLLWFGPATFFVTNLVASSARRSNAESLPATVSASSARPRAGPGSLPSCGWWSTLVTRWARLAAACAASRWTAGCRGAASRWWCCSH